VSDSGPCPERYRPISAYALIGDCHTAALVSDHGSIDWYCPTRFDAPAVFCRLLDDQRGGLFQIAPPPPFSTRRRYVEASNVLETTFATAHGRVRLTDLLPVQRRTADHAGYDVSSCGRILRRVEALAGDAEVELRFRPTFDFARPNVGELAATAFGALARHGQQQLELHCPGVELTADGQGGLQGRLRLGAGEQCWIVLSDLCQAEGREPPDPDQCQEQLAQTLEYWQEWAESCTYRGPYRDQVLRSALALKLLTYEPTGALVAAPTTSLPEDLGGERNWDYRYTWLRDSSLILFALLTVGYEEEAQDFIQWLEGVTQRDPHRPLQVLYTVDGEREVPERTLDHLAGYACSRPVRVGNAAASQRQFDIYGSVLNAAELHYRAHGLRDQRHQAGLLCPTPEVWALLRDLVEQAAQRWEEPDNGIWEVRGRQQQFLYSRLMCWAALDRGIRLAQAHQLPAPLARWQRIREEIRAAILERGYDRRLGAFTQAFGSQALDASALAIPRIGFLPATDPRVRSTVERIRQALTQNGLVYRYCTDDGIAGGEATFALCSFWLVDALALQGRLDEATELFERVIGYANDVGLLSEEIDPVQGLLLGNFPQGFTHLGLIQSAVLLAQAARHGPEEEAQSEADRAGRAGRAAAGGHPRHRGGT